MKIIIINGPNLNLLGIREPEIYGKVSFGDFFKKLQSDFPKIKLEYFQSNDEGELIDKLHDVGFSYDGIILNAGGYTHTSVALADAVAAIKTPVIEAHISNPKARETFRHVSLLAPKCKGSISGLGMDGYRFAVELILENNK